MVGYKYSEVKDIDYLEIVRTCLKNKYDFSQFVLDYASDESYESYFGYDIWQTFLDYHKFENQIKEIEEMERIYQYSKESLEVVKTSLSKSAMSVSHLFGMRTFELLAQTRKDQMTLFSRQQASELVRC